VDKREWIKECRYNRKRNGRRLSKREMSELFKAMSSKDDNQLKLKELVNGIWGIGKGV
jgi:Ca2+-binding EF-hand superfamily protein